MKFSRNTVITVMIAIAVVLLNALLFYSICCAGDIYRSVDVYGTEYTLVRSDIDKQSRIIASLPENKEEAVAYIEERLEQFNSEYVTLMTDPDPEAVSARIRADIELYEKVLQRITYDIQYDEYINKVLENSETFSRIDLYRENSFLLNNINKTRRDFYGLDAIDITVVSDAGTITFINWHFTDIFALFLVLLTIAFMFVQEREYAGSVLYRRRSILPTMLLLAVSIGMMYLCNWVLTSKFICEIPMDALVQSFEPFRSCPYTVSFGVFGVGLILMKLFGCMAVFALVSAVLTAEGKKRGVLWSVIGGFILLQILTALSDTENSAVTFLREINIVSFFSFERFFIRYLNLNIASLAVSRLPMFLIFATVLIIVSCVLAVRGFAGNARRLVSEAERGYYDEINRRYLESRKIRHDIANHLLAISALVESGKIDEARRYIGEVSEENDLAVMPVKTGVSVLDALLYKKAEWAKESGISLTVEVNCPLGDTTISNYDFCTVFGNILDNAFEAVQPLKGNRRVQVLIEKQLDMLYIRCTNPYAGEVRIRGEKLLTSKADSGLHGYGIARVKDIARKHGGDVKITAGDGTFLIEILMNM